MAYLALSPVAAAVYTKLNVAALTVLATGGIHDDLPQAPTYPCILFDLQERDLRGFGGGGLPEVALRVHTFSTAEGLKSARAINQKVIELLRDAALTVTGYAQCGRVFYDETIQLLAQDIGGIKVHELVSQFRIYVQES